MARRVVITGVGLLSAAGASAEQLHKSLCAGRPVYRHGEQNGAGLLRCNVASRIEESTELVHLQKRNVRPLDRISRLVTAAAHLTLEQSGWSREMRAQTDVGLVVGTMYCGVRTIGEFDRRAQTAGPGYASPMDFANTVMNAAAGQAALWHNLRGLNATLVAGAASGLQAIGYAADAIRAGRATAVLAGGVEELSLEATFAFERAGFLPPPGTGQEHCAVPFDAERNGFIPGEAAALVMLEDEESAKRRGAAALAEIAGYATAHDRQRSAAPNRSVHVAQRCIERTLADSGIAPEDVDCVMASANGSKFDDAREAQALRGALNSTASRVPVTAIKSVLGETVGASGPLQVIAAIQSFSMGQLPPIAGLQRTGPDIPLDNLCASTTSISGTHALVNAFSFDGMLCSMVLRSC